MPADFNGDGNPDLAAVNDSYPSTLSILLGNGDGSFQEPLKYTVGIAAFSIAVGDFDRDGRIDVAVANQGYGTGPDTVSVLLGNGDGTLRLRTDYQTGRTPLWIAIGDFNRDGNLDLVTANTSGSSISILLGNGDGTFQSHVDYPTATGPYSVAVADLNGDSNLDLAVATNSWDPTGSASILLGNGDGTFQPYLESRVGTQMLYSIAAGDFDTDGKLDLATGSSSGISLLLGKGNGTFQNALDYYEYDAFVIGTGDLNRDGRLDLATGYQDISVLLESSPPTIYNAFVQQPINGDGSSVFSAKRGVIPVKFTLTQNNAPTCTLPAATISVTRTAGGTLGSVDESVYSMQADSGSKFRIDPTACQYIYNLAASSLGVGVYGVDISINGIIVGNAVFALK